MYENDLANLTNQLDEKSIELNTNLNEAQKSLRKSRVNININNFDFRKITFLEKNYKMKILNYWIIF
jgi:uncharacterized Fe-S cluster-containing MiaB family protein